METERNRKHKREKKKREKEMEKKKKKDGEKETECGSNSFLSFLHWFKPFPSQHILHILVPYLASQSNVDS